MNLWNLPWERIYAFSLLSGFAVSLLVFISGGKLRLLPRVRFRIPLHIRLRVRFPAKWKTANAWSLPLFFGMFLLLFGASGLVMRIGFGMPRLAVVPITFLAGFLGAVGSAVFATKYLADTAEELSGIAVSGLVGRISLAIPPQGIGSVACTMNGKRVALPARTQKGTAQAQGKRVLIIEMQRRIAVVEEL